MDRPRPVHWRWHLHRNSLTTTGCQTDAMDEPVNKPAKVTTEQFRVIVAMCMVVITACLVFGAIQLRQI